MLNLANYLCSKDVHNHSEDFSSKTFVSNIKSNLRQYSKKKNITKKCAQFSKIYSPLPDRLFSLFKERGLVVAEDGRYRVDPDGLKSIEFELLGNPEQVFADFFDR